MCVCVLCVQSVDLSALGAQALAQVEKARKAAAESLASALNHKPKLDLTLELDAPKIAIPVPATEDGRGMYSHMQRQVHNAFISQKHALTMVKVREPSCSGKKTWSPIVLPNCLKAKLISLKLGEQILLQHVVCLSLSTLFEWPADCVTCREAHPGGRPGSICSGKRQGHDKSVAIGRGIFV